MNELYQRSLQCIAQGALTNSKRAESFVKGVYPTHLIDGKGCRVRDASGKRYIDYICSLGANLLGHGYIPASWLMTILDSGVTLSLGTKAEVEFAEELKEVFPFIDQIKILKTGSEACTAAMRIARAFQKKQVTGAQIPRRLVLSDGYHGWHDEFVSLTEPASGVAGNYYIKKLNKLDDIDEQVAAVIIEPVITDYSLERKRYIQNLRDICTRKNVILIFDEVITGFRFPNLSVSRYWGVEPDLICLGKALGNGLPLGVVGGKKELMNDETYFVSSTFAGERLSIEAARYVLRDLKTKPIIKEMWEHGQSFVHRFNSINPNIITIEGYPTRGILKSPQELFKALFMQEACKAGILFGPSWFFNYQHPSCTDQVINISRDIINRILVGNIKLQGELPKSPFAQKVRQ